jgi:hypothetical protein
MIEVSYMFFSIFNLSYQMVLNTNVLNPGGTPGEEGWPAINDFY